jgi:hypothetical protein
MDNIPPHQIRAVYDAKNIRVYQAYNDEIADAALLHGRFVSPPFKMNRMTWIKPSFLWMMYRSGWGYKDQGQRRILAIDITREGFTWALEHSSPSHPEPWMNKEDWARLKDRSPVRIQWDPERNLRLEPLSYRCIQIGLSKAAVELYVTKWTRRITDVTPLAHTIHALLLQEEFKLAESLLPLERPYDPI